MKRGELWWAELPEPSRSEPGFRRPVLVIQSDDFNRSRIRTVVGVAITTNLKLAAAPGNVALPERGTGLPKQSVINVSQIITLDKGFLSGRVGRVTDKVLRQVEDGLRLVLSQ
ncbi:type II toxin-antitoxin system PemK/MazF family toxin [Candidatus Rariloculus sp.]|uniref:type II toxin-antitoxin system PemK/MazF family toxin n=1 Tax=Candidatus Rariloculus sp. TaxID=3101265 RepID=UPI003D141600